MHKHSDLVPAGWSGPVPSEIKSKKNCFTRGIEMEPEPYIPVSLQLQLSQYVFRRKSFSSS